MTAKKSNTKISETNYLIFFDSLKYNYPIESPPYIIKMGWDQKFPLFKSEVLNNLLKIENVDRLPYLNLLFDSFHKLLKNCNTNKDILDRFYRKYKTSEDDFYTIKDLNNPLHVFLISPVTDLFERNMDDIQIEMYQIQTAFYNYHYSQVVRNALLFIQSQIELFTPTSIEIKFDIDKMILEDSNIDKTSISSLVCFFDGIEDLRIGDTEIFNYTKKVTNDFQHKNLVQLNKEFEDSLKQRKIEKIDCFSIQDIENAIADFKLNGKDIPYLDGENKNDSLKSDFEAFKNVDFEKLLFPLHFFGFYEFRGFINKKINEASNNDSNNTTIEIINDSFNTILTPEKATFILNMLEDLSITSNGNSILGDRKKSALRGVVDACLEKNILPQISIDRLCSLIAAKINLEIKAKLDFSNTAKSFKKQSISYIEKHYNK